MTAPYEVLAHGHEFAPERLVYALVDPQAPTLIRYVGHTTKGALSRYAGHLADSNGSDRRGSWVRKLTLAGRAPMMVLLERVVDDVDIKLREMWWIDRLTMRRLIGGLPEVAV